MDWIQWLIPLVGVAVWILSSIVKSQQEETRGRPVKQARAEEEEPRPRRTPEEIERFLEEVRRRKKTAEERERQPVKPPPLPPPTMAKPKPPPRATPRSVPQTAPPAVRNTEVPKELQRTFRSAEEALEAVFRVYGLELPDDVEIYFKESGKPRRLTRQEVRDKFFAQKSAAPSDAIPVAEVFEVAAHVVRPTAAPTVSRQAPAPAAAILKGLLANRKNLAAAILLKEILEPPLCKRRK